MFANHEFDGAWWLAADPERALPGTLSVEQGDARLKVLGHFGSIPVPPPSGRLEITELTKPGKLKRIIGRTVEKEEVTLEGALVGDFPGDVTTYDPPWVLIGKAFADGEEILFDELLVQLSDFDSWVGASGFERQTRDLEESSSRLGGMLDIKFEKPADIEIQLDHGERATIEFWPSHSGWRTPTTSVTVSHTASLRLRFAQPHSLNELAHRVGQLRNFFCLAVGTPISVLSVTGYRDDHRRQESSQLLPIRIYWRIPHNPQPEPDSRHPIKMAFTLSEAPGGIAIALTRWFELDRNLRPVFILFFSVRYHPDLYTEVRFLSYSQAIEVFDRLTRKKPKASMRQRMRATLKRCPTVASKLLDAAGTRPDDFEIVFQDTRDFYTHYNPGPRSQAARDLLLFVMLVQLEAIIEMLLLSSLGLSDSEIDAIFAARTRRYELVRTIREQATDERVVVPEA